MTGEAALFDLTVERGACHAIYVYDVAQAIALATVRARASELGEIRTPPAARRAPARIEVRPEPLRLARAAAPLTVGAYRTLPSIELNVYDFGAITIAYEIPLSGPASGLLDLSCELVENAVLLADSRRQCELVAEAIRSAMTKPAIAPVTEDYVVFRIESFVPPALPSVLCERSAAQIAQVLRSEKQPLSQQEVSDAVAARISYGTDDAAYFDWSAAVLFDSEADDTLAVVEFANVQLLEMRFLDGLLDRALEEAYDVVARGSGSLRSTGHERWRVAQLQVDGAILSERVANSLKLVGEQYLARVHGALAHRFRIATWDSSIRRKLETLEGIYEKLSDRAATKRMEILEWIIIALFVVSIAISLALGH